MLAMEIYEDENPRRGSERISDQKVLARIREEKTTQWQSSCIIYFAMNVPADDSYSIRLKWGEYETKTDSSKARNGLCEFYKHLIINDAKFPCTAPNELPDLFLYLLDGDKPICFKRIPA